MMQLDLRTEARVEAMTQRVIRPIRSITRELMRQQKTNTPFSLQHPYKDEIRVTVEQFKIH